MQRLGRPRSLKRKLGKPGAVQAIMVEATARSARQLEGIAKAKQESRCKGRPATVHGEAVRAALAGDRPMAAAERLPVARSAARS